MTPEHVTDTRTPVWIDARAAVIVSWLDDRVLAEQGRSMCLTPQARLLLEHAVAVAAELERAHTDHAAFGDGRMDHIAIGAFSTAVSGIVPSWPSATRAPRPGHDPC